MDTSPTLGTAMTAASFARVTLIAVSMLCTTRIAAADNYALIVSGASGGPAYAEKYHRWRTTLETTLTAKFGYPADRVVSLEEASRDRVQRALLDLRMRVTKDDLVFVALIGHGADEKFNLVGPDMSGADWAAQLATIPARMVIADMTSSSFAFLRHLTGSGRIVITANDSAAQQFETVFPEFFIRAFTDATADGDKDGRVSMFEAFEYATAGVRAWFDRQNQLATEHGLLDNEGAARVTFLQPRAAPAGDPVAKRQAEIESAIADLKSRRPSVSAAVYDAEMERLLTELARLSAQTRPR
jgi:hypothetical protein